MTEKETMRALFDVAEVPVWETAHMIIKGDRKFVFGDEDELIEIKTQYAPKDVLCVKA